MFKRLLFIGLLSLTTLSANAQDMFTGQKKAACEAIMCLSTGSPPHECDDSLKKFFEIVIKDSLGMLDPRKTKDARKNFLDLCPNVDEETVNEVNTAERRAEYETPYVPLGSSCDQWKDVDPYGYARCTAETQRQN